MIKEIKRCRICRSSHLIPVLNLGHQALTGIFPRSEDEVVPRAPLELVKCDDSTGDGCGLLQLKHSCDPRTIYGRHYGYRSGLNSSMVDHLRRTVEEILRRVVLEEGDTVVDIGSNDGTLLNFFEEGRFRLIGVDPTAKKFQKYYRRDIHVIPDFFSPELVRRIAGAGKIKVFVSLSMFYDLEDPLGFMGQIERMLAPDGVWLMEQSYMPAMLSMNAYDTICHEHLEYYALKQIKWMADRTGLKLVDVDFNPVNGGSFRVVMSKKDSSYKEAEEDILRVLEEEKTQRLNTLLPYERFLRSVVTHREHMRKNLDDLRKRGKTVLGYGASTKGNVLLQYCGLSRQDIPYIVEINEDKFGSFTPGTHIPIVSEDYVAKIKPDYLLVLPWHFKENIMQKERKFLNKGGVLLFPLPDVHCVSANRPSTGLSNSGIVQTTKVV